MTSREYPTRPIIGLGLTIFGPQGVLLIKRGKPPRMGSWSLPGGAQKVGETVAEGLAREAREETGLDVKILEILDVVDSINRDPTGEIRFHYTLIDAAAIVVGGSLQAGSDAMDAKWFTATELAPLNLWSETHRIISQGFARYEVHLGSD